jgi:hypothetical protein
MGVLRAGDEVLHYSDSSHRWINPAPNADRESDEAWAQRVKAHRDEHARSRGPSADVPRQRVSSYPSRWP